MEKVDLGEVKTTTRIKKGVEQTIRLFTKTQRQLIMKAVDNRPDDMTIEDVLNLYDVSPVVYYTWVRNLKEDTNDKKADTEVLPNPLLDSSIGNLVFSSESQLRAFYLEKSPELKAFIEQKFKEWTETDVIAQISSKISSENIAVVAEAGKITVEELTSFLKRENQNLSYFTVEAIKRFLEI
jgi:hypothetical protein